MPLLLLLVQSGLEAGIIWPTPGEKFWERAPRTAPAPVPGGIAPRVERDNYQLEIVHVTAEMAPIAKASCVLGFRVYGVGVGVFEPAGRGGGR